MAAKTQTTTDVLTIEGVDVLSEQEWAEMLDRQARKLLGMSGEEFARRYRAGEFGDDHDQHSEVVRLSMLLPFDES